MSRTITLTIAIALFLLSATPGHAFISKITSKTHRQYRPNLGAFTNGFNAPTLFGVPPSSPPVSFKKFLTMQEKRVVVTLRYTGGLNLRPYFLTTASLIKKSHPDCLIEKIILTPKPGGEKTFELLVDEKLVIGRSRCRDLGGGKMSVYLNWGDIDAAMIKARRKRRPSTGYNAEKMS